MTYAVILAGGWGERLWPMSTRQRPKQLLTLTGEGTLVGDTLRRIEPLVSLEDALIMTSAELRDRVVTELSPVPADRVVGEPVGRNTAPAIALAAKILTGSDPEAVMVVLPADHVISDDRSFREAIELAVEAAGSARALVTLGIRPTRAETEYGYIRAGGEADMPGVFEVRSFEEKPDLETAEEYVAKGGYYWNSGMFIWRADVFLKEVSEHIPDVASALEAFGAAPGDEDFGEQLERYYGSVEGISVDYGVMEKAERVLVIPAAFDWDDVGAWPALSRVWGADGDGNTVSGDVVALDSNGCVVYAESGTVAVLGMSDVVVVRTPDATLVCPKGRARDVRDIVRRLKQRGAEQEA